MVGTLLLVTAAGVYGLLPERPVTLCSVVAETSGRVFESLVASALPLPGSREAVRTDHEIVLAVEGEANQPEPAVQPATVISELPIVEVEQVRVAVDRDRLPSPVQVVRLNGLLLGPVFGDVATAVTLVANHREVTGIEGEPAVALSMGTSSCAG